ncbi:helix-turn-helix transcriptional regulator, partial [Candidatus Saccharibacteria bacterium]|nr:helix-turn-helix transcriptional regulator [Candidatus Saccharibacteria bacterium]
MHSIADNIKYYRNQSELSQEKLAELLGVNRGTIVNWEKGNSAPDAWQIEDLAKIFRIEVKE